MKRIVASMWLAAGLALAGLAASPAPLQAQDAVARARAALPPDAAAAFEREVAAAAEAGLPTDPLAGKVLEGVAKRVPPARIVEVVRALRQDLGRAHGLLQPAVARPEDLIATAHALGRGTPEDAIRTLRSESRPDEPFAMATITLADLIERGVPPALAVDILRAWRARGAEPSQLPELPAAVERLMRQGAPPAHAAAAVLSGVRGGQPPGAIGRRGQGRGQGPPGQPPGRGRGRSGGRP